MSIYITQQQKEDWETEVTKLKQASIGLNFNIERQYFLEELLSKAIVLPVEESWVHLSRKTNGSDYGIPSSVSESYPNGVIIKQQS